MRLLLVLGLLLVCAGWMPAAAMSDSAISASDSELGLSDRTTSHDAWPVVTLWSDPDGHATVDDVLQRLDQFQVPVAPAANLGVRTEAIWLRIPVHVPPYGDGRWIFDVNYPALDRIDLHVVAEGRVIETGRSGDSLRLSERPLAARSHAMRLHLVPGLHQQLLVRVQSTSTLVLPITLMQEDAYHAREAAYEAWQGLLTGIALCLLIYSLAQWFIVREVAFVYYGINVLGLGLFAVNQYGLGAEHLWGESLWLMARLSPLSVLLALVGSAMFIDRVLMVREAYPFVSRVLRVSALLALLAALLFTLDLVPYQFAGLAATLLGPVPMLLGVPVAWLHARRGDRAAVFIFVGWGLYSVGVVVMMAFLRGHAPTNFWTQHALQFSALCEMAMWMLVLGVRSEEIRRAAEQAHRDRDRMAWLAHTDPLTGALNRRGLYGALQPLLEKASPQTPQALYLLDLDGFKPVNDMHGHEVGDALLVEVVRRLQAVLRSQDLVARTGGDEFVVVAAGLGSAVQAEIVGSKLVQAFSDDFEVLGRRCQVGATVGYVLMPIDGRDADTLMRRADAAMYAGKQAGKRQLRRGAELGVVT
ncbi:MAG: diguanylate cyclase [Leptothrix sp. (in: b-proteobacteria)]